MGRYVPAPGGLSNKLHAKAAVEKQQSITLVNQGFDERKIVVLRSDAWDKTAKQNESDDHFRLADYAGVIGKGYADLRDLPLGGTWIGMIRKLACHSFGSRSRSLPAI